MTKKESNAFDQLCDFLDSIEYCYSRNKAKLEVNFNISGDDFPINVNMQFLNDCKDLDLCMTIIDNGLKEDKILEMVYLLNYINHTMLYGKFVYDQENERIYNRIINNNLSAEYNSETFEELLSLSVGITEEFNDIIIDFNSGKMDLEQALAAVDNSFED